MRRCDREEIDPPWPRLPSDGWDALRDLHEIVSDPLLRRACGIDTRARIGFTARPWPIVAERVTEHLRDSVTLP